MKIGDKFGKVKTGVGGIKTRSMVVVLLVGLVVAGVLIWTALRDTTGEILSTASVKHVKPLENLPGAGEVNVVYNPLQEQQNAQQAKEAAATGKAAIPSLLNQGGEGYGRGGFGNLNDGTGRCGEECYDQNGYDQQGYDKNGFDKDGYDRNGYDKDGYDRDGFDRQGYDRDGFNKQGCNRLGLDRQGKPCAGGLFDKDCFNPQGKDKNGCDRQGKDSKGMACYDAKGFNKEGYDKCGLDLNGHDKGGFDKDGYDKDGFDKNGFDRNGCDRQGKNKEGKACYDAKGFTADGFDKNGFNKDGFGRNGLDRQGYDKNGLNAKGFDRMGFDKDGCDKDGKDRQGKACHGGTAGGTTDLANLLSNGPGGQGGSTGAGGGPQSAQQTAASQYSRLLADQQAMQAQQMAALTSQQQADLAAQQQQQIQATASLMSNQAQALIAAWAPPTQNYVKGTAQKEEKTAAAGPAQNTSGLPPHGTGPIVQRAGDIVFAIIDTSINSDQPGPVLARIVSGPLKGSRVLGTFDRQDTKLLLTFTTLSMPSVPESIGIDAIAIDPETARTALASDVDHHYLTKYGTLLASSFLQGMGQAVQTSIGTPNLSSSGSATIASTVPATTQDQIIVGLGAVGQQLATDINQVNIQPTVTLNAGTGVGLLIMSDLRVEQPASGAAAQTPDFGLTTSGRPASNLAPVSSTTSATNASGQGATGATSSNSTTTNSTTVYNPAAGITSVSSALTPTAGAGTANSGAPANVSNTHP